MAPETILVVEDQDDIRKITRRILEARGYSVRVAATGAEALRISQESEEAAERIDLLLTDAILPGMSGREVALLLCPAHPNMRVLFMSGYSDECIVQQGILEPGMAFLHKPFTADVLARKVREVLDAPRGGA
jgi:two-component system cell cycle sensor histidine kinase/response regulator CckA